MPPARQDVNHRDERYDGAAPDILDNAFVIVDFANGARAMLDLCMFAEGAATRRNSPRSGRRARSRPSCRGRRGSGPTISARRRWPSLSISPRAPKGPRRLEVPVDPALLAAGDHNGATFYQHRRFAAVVRGEGAVEVGLADGWWAVAVGLAAQRSAATGRAVDLAAEGLVPATGGGIEGLRAAG